MIEWIISSAVLTAIVIVLRAIFKGRMSLRLQYALWLIVLVRLLVPISFGSTGMSVQNVVARPAAETPVTIDWGKYVAATPVEYNPELYPAVPTKEEFDKYSLEDLAQMYGYDEIRRGEVRSDVPSISTVREAQHLTVNEILNIVWACGAGAIALWLLITNLHFYGKLRRSRERLDVDGEPLPVYVTDRIDTPCLFGLICPKIYVTPEVAADEIALHYSVEHEATHRRHGDHLWSLLRGLCLAVYWFNPLVWVAAILSRGDAELACDEATIRRIGEDNRAEYGRTLIRLTFEKRPMLFVAATTMTGSGRSIKERIKLIVKKPKTAILTLIAIVLVIAVAVGCTFTGAKPEADTERASLDVSDLPAILNAIDLQEATLILSGEKDPPLPAGAAICAENYLAELKQYTWEKYPFAIDETYVSESYIQLAAPRTTLTFYGNSVRTDYLVRVETDGAEGWFRPPVQEGKAAWTEQSAYREMYLWYQEADGALLYGGEGRLLTAEELEFFREYTLSQSIFFTSRYSDVRDMNAWWFLRYFNGERFEPQNSAERQLQTEIKLSDGNTWDYSSPEGEPAMRIPRADVDAYLLQYAGVTVEEMHTNWFEKVSYLPETDCFYIGAAYFGPTVFNPVVGVQNGSTVTLWARSAILDEPYKYLPFDIVKLEQSGDGWRILSFTMDDPLLEIETTTPIQHIKQLELSDLPAIFDAIDLNEALLTYYTGFSTSYPAAAANNSEQYFETLKQIPWQACNMGGFDVDDFNGSYIQLVVPHTTARLYEVGLSGENLLYVETDDAEGWFQPSPGTNAFNQALDWFTEVHGASLWGGNGRILSEEELESFRAFTSSTYKTYDAQGNLTTAFPTEISCFFTSYYSNVRDMDAYSFLWYFPSRSEDRTVDETEWQLVQQVQDWRRGEDNHLMTMEELGVPVHRIPRTRVNEVLMKYAGVTVEDMNTNWFEEMTYIPATDCFYVYTSDAGCGTFIPWFGIEHGDLVSLWAHNAYGPCRLDLIKDSDGWRILDHVLESCPPLGFKEEVADWERTFLAGRLEYCGYGSENAQFDVLYNKADRAAYLFGATERGYVVFVRYTMNFVECGDGNPYDGYMDAQKYYVGMTYGVLLPEGYYNLTTQQFEEK